MATPEPDDDLQKRLNKLETQVAALKKEDRLEASQTGKVEQLHTLFTHFLTVLAIVLTVGAVGQGAVTYLNRSDAKEARVEMQGAVKDMEAEVEKAVKDINEKFEALASDAKKKPDLRILTRQGPLDGQTFEVPIQGQLPVFPLFLENVGNKQTETVSLRFFSTVPLPFGAGDFFHVASREPGYPECYYPVNLIGAKVAAKETWTLDMDSALWWPNAQTNLIHVKLFVFFGVEDPVVAKFLIKVKAP